MVIPVFHKQNILTCRECTVNNVDFCDTCIFNGYLLVISLIDVGIICMTVGIVCVVERNSSKVSGDTSVMSNISSRTQKVLKVNWILLSAGTSFCSFG